MAGVARDFCNLIERIGEQRDPSWLRDVFLLLPRLHVAVVSLHEDGQGTQHPAPDWSPAEAEDSHFDALEHRFELYRQVRSELGEQDNYWLEFDPVGDGHEGMSGSLADDLVDIYHDIKHGLELLESGDYEAIEHWKRSYRLHWGQHLVDAERHLYALKSRQSFDH
jgi:hypothetical protein